MTFEAPVWLALLGLLPLLAVGYLLLLRAQRSRRAAYADERLRPFVLPTPPRWAVHVPAVLLLVSLGSALVAVARPVADVGRERTSGALVVALDTSTSMLLTDVAPSRIEAALAAARTFVGEVPESVQVGLVTFAGTATVAVPPTDDEATVTAALQDPPLAGGTAIGEAVHLSVVSLQGATDRLRAEDPEAGDLPMRVVLLSDGRSGAGRPTAAAADEARSAGIPVDTIAIGSPDAPRGRVDVEGLRALAEATGGTFQEAADGAQITEAYERLAEGEVTRSTQRPIGDWFLGLAGVAAMGAAATAWPWFRRLPL